MSNIKSFAAHLQQGVNQYVSPQYLKSKVPDPAVVTMSELSLATASLDTAHNTDRNEVTLQTLDDSTSQIPSHASVPTNSGQDAVCLPKLSIPIFAGDPLDWQPFWDSFEGSNSQ